MVVSSISVEIVVRFKSLILARISVPFASVRSDWTRYNCLGQVSECDDSSPLLDHLNLRETERAPHVS